MKMQNLKRKIKICHVANSDSAVGFLLINQLEFMQRDGFDVYIACNISSSIDDLKKKGFTVKNIGFSRKIFSLKHLVAFMEMLLFFRKEKFDIVHTHNPVPGFLGQLSAKMAGVPIIINTVHGFYFSEKTSPIKRTLFIFLEKISSKCSSVIFSQSYEDVNTAINEGICRAEKIKYLGNGIDLKKFNLERFPESFIENKRKKIGLIGDHKIIGVVARLVKEKGYLELFQSFREIIKIFPNAMLMVIGLEEPEKSDRVDIEVISDIKDKIFFLGQRKDVDELYPLMDVFVLPSYREGMPRSVLEAMAMERPVVATNIRGVREEIEDGKSGILVPMKNPQKLAEAIEYLLNNPNKAKELGRNARIRVEQYFNEDLVFDKIKKEYDRLILEKINETK